MKFLEDLLWEWGENKRRKRQDRWERSECAAGRHVLDKYDMPEFMGKYRLCKRWSCQYSELNPKYDPVKLEMWRKVERAKDLARKTAGAVVCSAKGHDMVYGDGFDWWSFCRRCGQSW